MAIQKKTSHIIENELTEKVLEIKKFSNKSLI